MKKETAAFFWFNSTTISDAGHRFYGSYVYEQLLRQLAPDKQASREAWFILFDGDYLSHVGPVYGWSEYFRKEDEHLLKQADQIRESSICYVVAVLGQSLLEWKELNRTLEESGMLGYIGMILPRDSGRDMFVSACQKMALCTAIRIDGARLKKIDFSFIHDGRLKEMGFEPYA